MGNISDNNPENSIRIRKLIDQTGSGDFQFIRIYNIDSDGTTILSIKDIDLSGADYATVGNVVDGEVSVINNGVSSTASNVGNSGVGVFKQKVGVNLEFKNISSGSNKISIIDNTADDEIVVDISSLNINTSELNNDAGFQTSAQVNTAIQSIIDSAPATLDTLNELAAALGDDANFATTIANQQATQNTNISNNASDIVNINNVNSAQTQSINTNTTSINNEVTNRQNADTNLQNQIDSNDTDITDLQNADINLQNQIDSNDTDIANLQNEQTTQDTAIANNTAKVSFPEAPNDGNQYARQNEAWAQVNIPSGDHGDLAGLGDDDHTQYHNDARGDARYYQKTELDSGQLDNRYYTETEIDNQQSTQDNAIALNTTKVSFPEAPNDGARYVRQSEAWSTLPAAEDGFAIFPIWAEENAAMGNNAYEWAYGNGATTQNNRGIIVPTGCELFAIGISSNATMTNTVVSVERNGINVAQTLPISGNNGFTTLNIPIQFTAGQNVNFRTLVAGGGSNAQAVAWFRKLSTTVAQNAHLFWTGTTTASTPLPLVNQPLNPPAPVAELYAPNGSIVNNNNGTFTLQGGANGASYKATGVIRGSTFSSGDVFYGARFKTSALVSFGNQSVVYSNAATNLFSAQFFCSGVISVPANTTVTVGLYLDFISNGTAEYSPARSFMSLERLR